MSTKILQMNKIFFTGIFTLAVLTLPFFVSAQTKPVVFTGGFIAINDNSAVRILGRADTGGDINANVWLEWGTGTSYFNSRTSKQTITTFSNVNFYLSSINQDTKYYYRVVAQNSSGISYGETKPLFILKDSAIEPPVNTTPQTSNTTQNYNYNYNYNNGQTNFSTSGASPIVITNLPENITTTSVKIKGLALPGGNIATNGWFEWGTTVSLGKETIHKNIGNVSSVNFSETLLGLSPNTIYYFRAVIQNQRGLSRGSIMKFKTKSVVIAAPVSPAIKTPVVSPSASVSSKAGVSVKKDEINKKEDNSQNDQMASVKESGKKFLPDTLIGWLLFTLLLLLVIALIDYLYLSGKKRKNEKKEKETEIETDVEAGEERVIQD